MPQQKRKAAPKIAFLTYFDKLNILIFTRKSALHVASNSFSCMLKCFRQAGDGSSIKNDLSKKSRFLVLLEVVSDDSTVITELMRLFAKLYTSKLRIEYPTRKCIRN
jgi:hypothetical protein